MDPGPMPTLTASAPASANARAASAVAILPATTSTVGNIFLTSVTRLSTPRECPCAVSITIASTPASTRRSHRSAESPPVPTAAATRSRPSSSLQASGNSVCFWISITVTNPLRLKSSSTSNTFSIRCSCSKRRIVSRLAPSEAVTSRSRGVMTPVTG